MWNYLVSDCLVSVYAITPNLWRWEIRCGGALLRCGAAPTKTAAEMEVSHVVHSQHPGQG